MDPPRKGQPPSKRHSSGPLSHCNNLQEEESLSTEDKVYDPKVSFVERLHCILIQKMSIIVRLAGVVAARLQLHRETFCVTFSPYPVKFFIFCRLSILVLLLEWSDLLSPLHLGLQLGSLAGNNCLHVLPLPSHYHRHHKAVTVVAIRFVPQNYNFMFCKYCASLQPQKLFSVRTGRPVKFISLDDSSDDEFQTYHSFCIVCVELQKDFFGPHEFKHMRAKSSFGGKSLCEL